MKKLLVLFAAIAVFGFSGLYADKKASTTIPIIDGGIKVDASLKDWKACGIKPVKLNTMKQVAVGKTEWAGAKVHSGEVYVAFTEDKIFMAAEVKNKKGARNKHKGGDIYKGTTVELFLGFDNSEPTREMYMETDYQVGISTGQWSYKSKKWLVPPQAYVFNLESEVEDAKIRVYPKKRGYIIEASLPLEFFEGYFVADDYEIGFDVGIDDVGSRGYTRKTQMTWSGDPEGWKIPKGWGKAIIKEKECKKDKD